MLDTVTRLLSGFLDDPVNGINAVAATIPRAGFLTQIAPDPAPPSVVICSDATDISVAKDLTPSSAPAIVIWADSASDVKLGPHFKIAKDVIVVAAFVTDEGQDPQSAIRESGYILRAGRLCCERFNSQAASTGFRRLNGVVIHEISRVTEQRVTSPLGRFRIWGWLTIHVTAVETLS